MRWDRIVLGVGVMVLVVVAVLLMRPAPGDPDPERNSGVAIDCSTGAGWIGYDGKTYCP